MMAQREPSVKVRLTRLGQFCIIALGHLSERIIQEQIMILRTLIVGPLEANCYLVGCERTSQVAIIDPGDDSLDILSVVRELGLEVVWILLTHFHFDHVLAAHAVQRTTGARVAIHKEDAPLLQRPPAILRAFGPFASSNLRVDQTLADGDTLSLGDLTFQVLHTPGHSPGSVSFYLAEEKAVFSGDTLFCEGVGRTDLPGGSYQALLESITRRLFALPDETTVYPGHGPSTTIGHERLHNPWLRAFR